jgi:Na+-translocating ferredoxin:NAD+ oxidoreductase RnfD subunit
MNTKLSATPTTHGAAETLATETPLATPTEERSSPFRFDQRFVAPVFITLILVVGQFSFGILESYTKTALAIVTSILVELILSRLFTGKWPHLASAYISGISVGILVRSPAIWPYALCSAISITSKYVLRVKGRHIWNPSNFGICALLFLAHETVASLSIQWGNNIWPMLTIWTLGSIIIYRLRRFHITFTYVASFILFAFLRSWITGHTWQAEVAPITGPMYQLFIFFMITDPKTTVRSKAGQIAVAFSVALIETILRLAESVHAPYYALFLVGPTANLIEIYLLSRRRGENKMTDLASPTTA